MLSKSGFGFISTPAFKGAISPKKTASLLDDFFTDKPNYTPYSLVYPSKEIFNPTNAMKRYNRDIDWRKVEKGPEMDDEEDMKKAHYKGQKK